MLANHDEAHIVDAMFSRNVPPGTMQKFDLANLPRGLTLASSHEVDLPTALELGRHLDLELPSQITVWGIEVADPFTICEQMTPKLCAALAKCVRCVLDGLTDA
jgi:hydrogenase maturation protease